MTDLVKWVGHARRVRMVLGLEMSPFYQFFEEIPSLPGLEDMVKKMVQDAMKEGKGLYARRFIE